MKRFLLYLLIVAIAFATSCTDFGTENQLTLPSAPSVEISSITAESQSITFTLAPSGTAGYYSYLVVESAESDSTLQADQILKQTASGKAKGLINYEEESTKTIVISDLTPYTVYQIYAVASSTDGVVSEITNKNIRTKDDGGLPSPASVSLADSTVTITFGEPIQSGTGKLYVSYFAKNTLSGSKPLVIKPGFEEFNPQDIEVDRERLTVSGRTLKVKLPAAPAGAYASITYDAGVVLDLEGNASNAYIRKADTLINGAPSRGLTVRLATEQWSLRSEFEDVKPDTLVSFTDWSNLEIFALPEAGTTVSKRISSKTPTVNYKEVNKNTTVNVTEWGVANGLPLFYLPEEPNFGSILDLSIPEGAFEDVYGNVNNALMIKDNYLYSYGYDFEDVVGTYDIDVVSNWDGALTETGIVIEKDVDSDTLLIKNLLSPGTVIKGAFDPTFGTITVEDWQLLRKDVNFGDNGLRNIMFVNYEDGVSVVFKVPTPGIITTDMNWGYYIDGLGWWDLYLSSTWTRTSTSTEPSGVPSSVDNNFMQTFKEERRADR
jgi:hypothetical protein